MFIENIQKYYLYLYLPEVKKSFKSIKENMEDKTRIRGF